MLITPVTRLHTLYILIKGQVRLSPAHQACQEEQDHSAYYRNDHARKVEASHSLCTENVGHQETTDDGTDNTYDNVSQGAHLGILTHNHACNPTSDCTKYDP